MHEEWTVILEATSIVRLSATSLKCEIVRLDVIVESDIVIHLLTVVETCFFIYIIKIIYTKQNQRLTESKAYRIKVIYSEFHKILCEKYNKCFPYRKLNKPYYNNKPWLTNALKESIKTKNKFFVARNKSNNSEERTACYKTHRNRLHHLLRTAERQYYQDLIMQHKDNIKDLGKW